MGTKIDLEPTLSEPRQDRARLPERRRPARNDQVSPALLPMLRGEMAGHPVDRDLGPAYPDQLSAIRGIAFSVFLSGLVIASLVVPFLLFRH